MDKVVWSGNGECSKLDLGAVNNGFLMVAHILNGTGHPTFSPPAPIPSSFLQEPSFCALAVCTHICSLWVFSACFAVWAVLVPVLFCSTLRCVPQQLTAGCMRLCRRRRQVSTLVCRALYSDDGQCRGQSTAPKSCKFDCIWPFRVTLEGFVAGLKTDGEPTGGIMLKTLACNMLLLDIKWIFLLKCSISIKRSVGGLTRHRR